MSPGIHWVGCWLDPVTSPGKISWCCQELKYSPELSTLYASCYTDRREWFVYCSVCCSAVLWLHSVVGSTAYQRRHGGFLHAARPVYLGSIWEKACCWWVHCLTCTCAHANINSLFQCVVEFCYSLSNEVTRAGSVTTVWHRVKLNDRTPVTRFSYPVNVSGHFC